MNRPLPDFKQRRIVELYESGDFSVAEIARMYDSSERRIYRVLARARRKRPVPVRRRLLTTAEKDRAVALYLEGKSAERAGWILGCDAWTVCRAVRARGIQMPRHRAAHESVRRRANVAAILAA